MEGLSDEVIKQQEKIQKTQSQYMLVSMDKIVENGWNPNRMNPTEYNLLKHNIDTTGGNKNGPIVVRTHLDEPGMYEIIDGAHRYRAMKELGFEEIICTLDEGTTPESMVKTLGYNKHRGINDDILLSGLINDLISIYGYTYEQITETLGYTYDELKDIEAVNNAVIGKYIKDEEEDTIGEIEKEDKISISGNFTIQLSSQQMEQFNLLLKNTGIKDKNVAVLACLKYFDDNLPTILDKKELIEWVTALGNGSIKMDIDDDL